MTGLRQYLPHDCMSAVVKTLVPPPFVSLTAFSSVLESLLCWLSIHRTMTEVMAVLKEYLHEIFWFKLVFC
jgi:hypothetical protein